MPLKTNIVSGKTLRKIQLDTLKIISDTISASFGPMGSNTLVLKDNATNRYTKDGFSILKEIKLLGTIEEAVRSDIEDILRNIVVEFGDNSSSAAILSYHIFEEICAAFENEEDLMPFELIKNFKEAVSNVTSRIESYTRVADASTMRDITHVSTNGNDKLANIVYDIYQKYGMGVHIDIATSPSRDFMIKELDGLTINSGFMDTCFINDTAKNSANIRNARVYYFEDPIDTPEMAAYFDNIIANNIINTYKNGREVIPTVILCPKFSKDYSSLIKDIVSFMHANDAANRLPLLIVTNIYDVSVLEDITHLCGCPTIKKFLDPKIQEEEVKRGAAPDLVTVPEFYGECELVVSTATETRFINPAKMYEVDEDGNRVESKEYKALVDFLETEIERLKDNGHNGATGEMIVVKKRLESLKSNLVELYVGGISAGERDSHKDLLEDAVLNCRSAAKYGYGYGANYEALRSLSDLLTVTSDDDKLFKYYEILNNAYEKVVISLYSTVVSEDKAVNMLTESLNGNDGPYNLRTMKRDGTILTSIRSDIAVLNALAKVITIMVTCNQVLLQNPVVNNYENN